MFGEDPQQSWQETVAPMRPRRPFFLPDSVFGIKRIKVGILFNQLAHLALRESERMLKQFLGITQKMNHV